ncbi:MAG: ornithine cyclodeaminase family protein [Firmicutes bacterium]|nr:ornithine cyclodeaminase family protein [Bacillota bacterium]
MIYLNADTLLNAAALEEIMDVIEQAYAIETEGSFVMPPRMHIDYNNNTLLYMPCFLETIFGTKILSLFPGNAAKGIPVISGLVLLNDKNSGHPLAILDGGRLTALRTGAVGGVAVRHTAPPAAKSAGLVGSGVQGYYQLLFASKARNLETISVYDLDQDKVKGFCDRLQKDLPEIEIRPAKKIEDLLDHSEIVITATPSEKPVLPDDEKLLQNKSYIGIGSYKPEMREFPRSLYKLVDRVLIDTAHGLEESGDLITPLQEKWIEPGQILEFGKYLSEEAKTEIPNATTLFKSVGMALFDIAVGELLYCKALEKGLGINLD